MISVVILCVLLILAAIPTPPPTSLDAAGWLVDVDDNPRGRSPCSGVRLAHGHVLTARHCVSAPPYVRLSSPEQYVGARIASDVPERDVLLLRVKDKPFDPTPRLYVSNYVPDLFLKFSKLWVLTRQGIVEAEVVGVDSTSIMLTAPRASLCFGDSGSPLLVGASAARLRVLGVLSGGDPKCTPGGVNRFVRVDRLDELKSFRDTNE